MAEIKQINRECLKKEGFPKPIPLSQKVMSSLSKEQFNILKDLTLSFIGEKLVLDKINSLKPTASGILALSTPLGPGLTVCEDEDDWRVLTIGERLELKEVRREIIADLNKALDLGLGFLDRIQEKCTKYGVKP